MPYIGHEPTNSGNFYILDDFNGLGQDGSSSTYDQNANGTIVNYKLMVAGVAITPNVDNLIVTIDGVLQHPTEAYSISGSILTFTEAPASGVDFHVVIMGQSATVGEGSIGADELEVSGDGTDGQLLKTDGDGTFSWINQNTVTASTANVATHVTVADNESTNENNLLTFVEDASGAGNVGLESDGDLHYNPSTGRLTATQLTGTLQTAAQTNITSVGTLSSLTLGGNLDIPEYLRHDGDTDTHIRFSAADAIEITAGNVKMMRFLEDDSQDMVVINEDSADIDFRVESDNLTHALFVQGSDGNVGIGCTPGDVLEIDGTNPILKIGNRIRIKADESNNNAWFGIGSDLNTINLGDADFGTAYMTIKGATGRVGIGTTAPDQILHCRVASGDPSIVCETESGGGARLKLIGADDNMSIQSSGGLLFYTGASTTVNGTERMRLHDSGYLQIGGSMGTYALNVRGSNECLALYSTDQYKAAMTLRRNSDAAGSTGTVACYLATRASMAGSGTDVGTGLWNVAGSNLYLGIGASPKLTVNSGGNIGIHEESPDHLLTISHNDDTDITSDNIWNGDCSGIHLRKTHDDSGGGSVIKFSADSHTSVAAIAMSQPNSAGDSFLHFYTSDNTTAAHMAERMRIDNSGYLKVPGVYSGNTSSAANVHVTSDGMIYRSTSAKKYKSYIKNYDTGLDMINQMQPISYKSKKSSVLDENDKTYAGLLADDIHDLGLSEFVEYNKDGEVENLFYDRMVVVCINAIKELSAKVAELEKA